jgi:hypothetical protein
MTRSILIVFLFLGIMLVVIEFVKTEKKCPKQKVIYKYIPRTFEEEQNEPVYPSDIFKAMFTQPTPWIGTINDADLRRKEAINQFFISQI